MSKGIGMGNGNWCNDQCNGAMMQPGATIHFLGHSHNWATTVHNADKGHSHNNKNYNNNNYYDYNYN